MIDVDDDLVAALAGRYEIERELGHGGMATVYLARDVRHDRHVALKVLRADLTSSLGAERFVREINIAARLSHPHILALYDSGAAANTLYYVMPHVAGETLRQRLDREHQLPLDEALAITRQIASALDYAHAQGVVHRDIKPENILLLDDHVLVADFGLARALYSAASTRLTGSAVAVGTPAYMSPEQAAADPQVDGRTDLYSLACVLFEMVTGSPPFHGATVQALMMHHLNSPPPSMCAQRTACPPWVDEAVQRALAKMPADRFRTAGQFVRALEGQAVGATPVAGIAPVVAPAARRRRRWISAGAATIVLAAAAVLWGVARDRAGPAVDTLDESLYVVAPSTTRGRPDDAVLAAVDDRLQEAFAEWNGVSLRQLNAGNSLTGAATPSMASIGGLLDVVAALGARWLVRMDVTAIGDSVTVRATLHDAGTGAERLSKTIRHGAGGPTPRMSYRQLVNALLRTRDELPWRTAEEQWDASLPAWRAYDRGREEIGAWRDSVAVAEFRNAIEIDPELTQAHLWLAQVQSWRSGRPEDWMPAARRAYDQRARLGALDALLAEAQVHLGEGRYPLACEASRRALQADSTDFRGWLGLGDCQARDDLVLRDGRSPSGLRFRSSWHGAVRAYENAIERMPPPAPAFVYRRLAARLFVDANVYRPGRGEASSSRFVAYPSFAGDTLAFVPYPMSSLTTLRGDWIPRTRASAISRNRSVLRDMLARWVRQAPKNADAHLMFANVLETTEELRPSADGQPSALAELTLALRLLPQGAARLEAERTRARLLVKTEDWAAAAALSDSLAGLPPDSAAHDRSRFAGLAALTGRARATARLLSETPATESGPFVLPSGTPLTLAPKLRRDGLAMFGYAALGVCTDSLRSFPARTERQLESYYPNPVERSEVAGAMVRRHLMLAAPCLNDEVLLRVPDGGDQWTRIVQAAASDNRAVVRAIFDTLMAGRHLDRPGDVAIEFTVTEAWALASVGDTALAMAHLDRSLTALPTLGHYLLDLPAQSAGLVRAMGLRAELAARTGDHAIARRWATAVSTLWAGADRELQPYVAAMRRIAAGR